MMERKCVRCKCVFVENAAVLQNATYDKVGLCVDCWRKRNEEVFGELMRRRNDAMRKSRKKRAPNRGGQR